MHSKRAQPAAPWFSRWKQGLALVAALSLISGMSGQVAAAEHIKVGALKATNVGAVYIALDKGWFAAEGLDVETVPFDSAQPIAVAAAGGAVDFGASATTGGFFSLAGQGTLKIISGLYEEAPHFHNFAILASLHAFDGGLKTYRDLAGHSVAVSQIGSPVHYALALIAEKNHIDLATLRILPLQSIPNMVSATIGNQTDAVVLTATAVTPLLDSGKAKLLGWVGDEAPWQPGVIFTTPAMLSGHAATVEAFLRALKRGARVYHDAYVGPDGQRQNGPTAAEVTAILVKYTGLSPDAVEASLAYIDPEERLDVADIVHQVEWFKSQKMLKSDVDGSKIMDPHYVVKLPER
jgi:NitT/TauT family transport system substrate-binding protein